VTARISAWREIHSAKVILCVSKRRSWRWTLSPTSSRWLYTRCPRRHESFFTFESDPKRFSGKHFPDFDWRFRPDRVFNTDRQPVGSVGVRCLSRLEHIAVGSADLNFRRLSTYCDVYRHSSRWPRRFFGRCPNLRLERNRDSLGGTAQRRRVRTDKLGVPISAPLAVRGYGL
jgi:hypothetical protein